jgi:hypothetical protein
MTQTESWQTWFRGSDGFFARIATWAPGVDSLANLHGARPTSQRGRSACARAVTWNMVLTSRARTSARADQTNGLYFMMPLMGAALMGDGAKLYPHTGSNPVDERMWC